MLRTEVIVPVVQLVALVGRNSAFNLSDIRLQCLFN